MNRAHQPKAMSLLYSIREHFEDHADWEGPEPEFWKWFDKVSCADIGECEDNVLWEKIDDKEKQVWKLFQDALYATSELLEFRQKEPELFLKAARRLSFLPTFLSWHPGNARFNQQLLAESELGLRSIHSHLRRHPNHLRHQSWSTRYAYAIVFVIDLNLETYSEKLEWMPRVYGFGRRHPIEREEIEEVLAKLRCTEDRRAAIREEHRGAYRILPRWSRNLAKLKKRFCKETVLNYWRIGKAMLLEEIPEFHERPEWKTYQTRHYANGATPGAVQHAIFRDILDGLRTIAPDEPDPDYMAD